MSGPRIAVASVVQETNTFAATPTTIDDFTSQGLWIGVDADLRSRGSNTEIAGALQGAKDQGATAIPLLRAWAMSGGVLADAALERLADLLDAGLRQAGSLDAVVLCLHGALVAESHPAADAYLAAVVRAAIGPNTPLIATHDLHANVTDALIGSVDALVGYHTYPHVDQASTGERAARLAVQATQGTEVCTVMSKRHMLVPPEAQAIADEPMRSLRATADEATGGPILDVSLFPVQPWLDVPELGFAVTVTHHGAAEFARSLAERLADQAWAHREEFRLELAAIDDALDRIRSAGSRRFALVQSADSPTAGAAADDATVIGAIAAQRPGVRVIATVVDAPAVDACWHGGPGAWVELRLGASIDKRWSSPVELTGNVLRLGDGPVVLDGPAMTGQSISLGRWATIDDGHGLRVLVTERPAPTFDPQAFRHVGLDPESASVIVVRSATLYRAGFAGLFDEAIVLDLPGASTPSFGRLPFTQVPRPMYPLAEGQERQWSHSAASSHRKEGM